jgi:hypothetical protein
MFLCSMQPYGWCGSLFCSPTDHVGSLLCHVAGNDLSCTDAVVVQNTGNRRLSGVSVAGSATCQMETGRVLEPSQQFTCSVSMQ